MKKYWRFVMFHLAAFFALVPLPTALAATPEPIRVGFMAPLSGLFAPAGRDMQEGFRLYFEQAGFQAAGRPVQLIEEDDEGNNAVGLAKYRKLVERDHIHVFAGILLSNIGYGLAPMLDRDRLPAVFLTTPDDLTKRRPARWLTRVTFSASQPMHALGDYAYRRLGYRRVAVLAMDNAFGHEQIGGFQRVFEDHGGKVIQKLWSPLNAQDFAPYLSQVRRDVDAVVSVFAAAQALRFVKQYQDYGLKGRLPLLGSGLLTDEHVLRSMGDEALGVITALNWSPVLENTANQGFVKEVEAKLGKRPSQYHASLYSAGRWIAEAAKLVNGNVEDREQFLAAIRRASEAPGDPRGPIKLDAYNNPTQNVYILKVERVGGRLQNTVVHQYPMVSQFWTYKPEEFLKAPVYSRDYPPLSP